MMLAGSDPLPGPLPEGRGSNAVPIAGPYTLSLQGEGRGEGPAKRIKKGGVNRNAGIRIKRNAKTLRKNMTEAEKTLWYHLRAQRFAKYKFRRQHPPENYIVDFVCLKQKQVVELDGGQHSEQRTADTLRTRKLEKIGFRVLRFWNNDITENLEGVLGNISLSLQGEG